MMALSKKMLEHEPGEIELLLPWYAAGTLNARDSKRVEDALAVDPDLAKQYAAIQQEFAETIALNESLGAPSMRPMQKLFAAINAEPGLAAPGQAVAAHGLGGRILAFFDSLSPRTLAWSASAAAVLVLLQAGVIGTVLTNGQQSTFRTASLSTSERVPERPNAPLTRALVPQAGSSVRALVRFAPDARVADITALLDSYHASIIDGAKGGLFRLQLGDRAMSRDEAEALIARLQREKIVSLAVATP